MGRSLSPDELVTVTITEVFLAVIGHLTQDEPQPDDDPQRSRT
jgi:hypothetical protein